MKPQVVTITMLQLLIVRLIIGRMRTSLTLTKRVVYLHLLVHIQLGKRRHHHHHHQRQVRIHHFLLVQLYLVVTLVPIFSGPHGAATPPPHPSVLGFTHSSFNYDELAAATNGFSQANLLGQGGFGYVHKGVLPNGKEIAVKSLKAGSGQGDREFQAEVEIISRVHHRHLVSLVGYCIAGGQRLLAYEFLPNSTLEYHLYGIIYDPRYVYFFLHTNLAFNSISCQIFRAWSPNHGLVH